MNGRKRRITAAAVAMTILMLLVAALFITILLTVRAEEKRDYEMAREMMSGGQYEYAAAVFWNLGEYKDSAERRETADRFAWLLSDGFGEEIFAEATRLYEAGKYSRALGLLGRIPDYSKSAELARKCEAALEAGTE